VNAVNLIPSDSRPGRFSISASPLTVVLLAGLGAALLATVLYVAAANKVTARRSELAAITAGVSRAQAAAATLAPYVNASQQRAAQLSAVRQLAATRFAWPHLLDQVAERIPTGAALSSLQAGTGAGGAAATPTAAASPPAVQLAGCATSQNIVAQTMQQLRLVDGVSDVVLSSSNDGSANATSSASATGDGGCAYPVQFQISLTLRPASGAAPAAASGATPAANPPAAPVATSTSTARPS
jgi:Tfp pilus assembly protein PilN